MQQGKSGLGVWPLVIGAVAMLWFMSSGGGTISAAKRAEVLTALGVYSDPPVIVFTNPG